MNFTEQQLQSLLRRDWAVRVLDAWARLGETTRRREEYPGVRMCAKVVLIEHKRQDRVFDSGLTEAESRLAAAEAVWPELPESVRAEIGERP